MNEFQKGRCLALLEKLSKKPIARSVTLDWTDPTGKLTLREVSENLSSNRYASLFDFYLDLRLLFEPRSPEDPDNKVVNIIISDIGAWLFQKVQNMPRSKEEANYYRVQKILQKINVIFGAMITEYDTSMDQGIDSKDATSQPLVSSKTPLQAGQKRIEMLQQRIEHLKTPEELQTVLGILQKHIPTFQLSSEVVIEGRMITKACANELRDYLNKVNA